MKMLRQLFQKKEFHLFLFFISIILFNWPFLNIVTDSQSSLFFVYIFFVWSIIIFLTCFIAYSFKPDDRDDNSTARRER
jgi:cbb3-type cytochrome oxidase subunit 3